MAYPPPQPDSLHDWAKLCNVDEIVAQAMHAIGDPVLIPVEDVLCAPMLCESDAIKACCNQWMDEGHYSRVDTVHFNTATLRIEP